jgi:outer membrane lipoprotein-sorting protein
VTRRYRFAVPVVVAALIAVGALIPKMDAAGAPRLPARSASSLIVKALSEHVSHLSGTIRWSADLGLPSLSSLTNGNGQSVASSSAFDPTSLLSGTQTVNIWIGGANRERISLPGTLQESDVVRNGNQAWVWDSTTAHVTHYVLAGAKPESSHATSPAPVRKAEETTPQAVARQILAGLKESTTSVSVAPAINVAGRPAYVLELAPDRSIAANRDSTVSSIDIAIDASTGLPLRVSVYAVGQAAAALQVGFTSISFSAPSSADLAAPHGLTTSTKVVHAKSGHRASMRSGPTSKPAHRSTHASKSTQTIGKDWGSILALSAPQTSLGSGGVSLPELEALATPVSGSWGSGRLLTSSLVNALFLPDGQVLVGATTPAALERAAAGIHS